MLADDQHVDHRNKVSCKIQNCRSSSTLMCSLFGSEQSRTVVQSCGNVLANSYADVITDHMGRVSYALPNSVECCGFLNIRHTISIFKNVPQKSSGVRSGDLAGNSMKLRHQIHFSSKYSKND